MPFPPSPAAAKYLQLLPRPPKPGLYAAVGDADLVSWSLRALAVTFAPENRMVWVDAANQFNAYWIGQSARAFHKDSKAVLGSFKYARPFTAFQLETMVNEKLLPAVRNTGALFAVIADPLTLYEAAEDQKYSISRSFELFERGLRSLAKEFAILLLMPTPKPTPYYHRLIRISDRVVYPLAGRELGPSARERFLAPTRIVDPPIPRTRRGQERQSIVGMAKLTRAPDPSPLPARNDLLGEYFPGKGASRPCSDSRTADGPLERVKPRTVRGQPLFNFLEVCRVPQAARADQAGCPAALERNGREAPDPPGKTMDKN